MDISLPISHDHFGSTDTPSLTTGEVGRLYSSPSFDRQGPCPCPRHAPGDLPSEPASSWTHHGWTAAHLTGVDGEALREIVVASSTDEPVLRWIAEHGHPHSEEDKQRWAEEVEAYRASGRVLLYLQATHPELAACVDFTRFSLLDLLDMDEGRLSIPSSAG